MIKQSQIVERRKLKTSGITWVTVSSGERHQIGLKVVNRFTFSRRSGACSCSNCDVTLLSVKPDCVSSPWSFHSAHLWNAATFTLSGSQRHSGNMQSAAHCSGEHTSCEKGVFKVHTNLKKPTEPFPADVMVEPPSVSLSDWTPILANSKQGSEIMKQ